MRREKPCVNRMKVMRECYVLQVMGLLHCILKLFFVGFYVFKFFIVIIT